MKMETLNKPFVKQFDKNGHQTNKLMPGDTYPSIYPNRKSRRSAFKEDRFKGNNKGFNLTVTGTNKYLRQTQIIIDRAGNRRTIEHYILR